MPQTQDYTRIAMVAIKAETVVDTFETIAAGDVFYAEIADTPFSTDGPNYEHQGQFPDYRKLHETVGPARVTATFRVPLKHTGTVDTPPEWGPALQSAGFIETINVSTSVVYTLGSTFNGSGGNPAQSYSCAIYENGRVYRAKGGFSNVVFTGVSAEPAFMEFTYQGAYQAVADAAILAPTYDAQIPPSFLGAGVTIGGATPKGVASFSIDIGNVITFGPDANDSSGIYGARITDRRPTGSLEIEMQPIATDDYYGDWRSGAATALNIGPVGSATNRWTIAAADVSRRNVQQTNREGIRGVTLPFGITVAAANTAETAAFSLTLT